MNEDNIVRDANPSLEVVRKWAYDENMFLLEQDEDLILHHKKYAALSVELACDSACPKNEYLFSILRDFNHRSLLHRDIDTVHAVYSACEDYCDVEPVVSWFQECSYLRSKLCEPSSLSEEEAYELAKKLLVGSAVSLRFKKTGNSASNYVEYMAYNEAYEHYKLYLYLNHETGLWVHSKFKPLEKID